LEIDVSEAVLPPFSGLSFVIVENYTSGSSLGRHQCSGYLSMITIVSPDDGGTTATESSVFNHLTTRHNNPENHEFYGNECSCPIKGRELLD
jgi:hypothetical protein